jgi:hypothetical protein
MRWVALIGVLLLCSCAQRHVVRGQTYLVGDACHVTLRMIGCDPQFSPPRCKKILATYDKDCERLEAK